jgi:hypothetical protein
MEGGEIMSLFLSILAAVLAWPSIAHAVLSCAASDFRTDEAGKPRCLMRGIHHAFLGAGALLAVFALTSFPALSGLALWVCLVAMGLQVFFDDAHPMQWRELM